MSICNSYSLGWYVSEDVKLRQLPQGQSGALKIAQESSERHAAPSQFYTPFKVEWLLNTWLLYMERKTLTCVKETFLKMVLDE